ncbi:MAG: hypothetical protein IJ091_09145 [Oscillospiraceae bacterium]|nr:hypothetical protein [Oscillospiraceae bacterium]
MKRLLFLMTVVLVLSLLSSNVFAVDKEDVYQSSDATTSLFPGKVVVLTSGVDCIPTEPNYANSNIFAGYNCLNQYTDYQPTSGTLVTFATYTNNDTQRYYRIRVWPNGYCSCGFAPAGATELSINRRRIFPSQVNMITTLGNNYVDFNVQEGSCFIETEPNLQSTFGLFAQPFQGGNASCSWTMIIHNPAQPTSLLWEDLSTLSDIPVGSDGFKHLSQYGIPWYQYYATGSRVGTCICGLTLHYE